MLKLLIISHALILEVSQKRWRKMAADHEVDVRILIPPKWYNPHFGEDGAHHEGKAFKSGRFEVCTVPTTSECDHTRYRIRNLRHHLREFQPDVIFCIHEEMLAAHRQAILCRALFWRNARLFYFSMHAFPRVPAMRKFTPKELLKQLYFAASWWLTRHGTHGALVHCPPIQDQMHIDGYRHPILLQTQIGVDPELFRPDPNARDSVRCTLGFDGFVIGMAGRLIENKGVLDLLQAVEGLSANWCLLFVGDGPLHAHILAWATQHGWQKRVHVTGYVKQERVATFMNAMDCFVLGTHTDYAIRYRDMFPLVVAQAMTMKLPVVGANGGGIPYQLGGLGLLFAEDDAMTLRRHLRELSADPDRRRAIGEALCQRALDCFCLESLNRQFLEFLRAQIPGRLP